MLIGLLSGLGLAFLADYLDDTLRTPQEVERYVRLRREGISMLGGGHRALQLGFTMARARRLE